MSKPSSPWDMPFLVSENEGDLGNYLRPVNAAAIAPVPSPLEINGAPAFERDKEKVILRARRRAARLPVAMDRTEC